MADEQEVAEEPGLGGRVAHGQVAVGVGGRPGFEVQHPAAEVEVEARRDQQGRRHDPGAGEGGPDEIGIGPQVIHRPRRQRLRQGAVADEGRALGGEGGVAEHVVGMDMGVDHVAHRQAVRCRRAAQALPRPQAAAGIDHRHRVAPDHEADIGDRPVIAAPGQRVGRGIDEDARRDLLHRQGRRLPGRAGTGSAPAGDTNRVRTRRSAPTILTRRRSPHPPPGAAPGA